MRMEKTNNILTQLPLEPGVPQEPTILIERTLPEDNALQLASIVQLRELGKPWREEIFALRRAGFTERAQTESTQERDIEFKLTDGSIVRSRTTMNAINEEIERKLQLAAEKAAREVSALEDEIGRLDDMGSVPTKRLKDRLEEKRKHAEYLKNDK